MPLQRLAAPDELTRKVLFAVDVVDPIALSLVWRGITLNAAGLVTPPIINHSGQWVWHREGDLWPGMISIDPGSLPFAQQLCLPAPRPADLDKATAAQRLLRVMLRPGSSYDVADGVTAIRGWLCETGDEDSPPVVGARVQLAWLDHNSDAWVPPKPQPEPGGGVQLPSPAEPETDVNGEFLAFIRLNPPKPAQPDVANGLLAVRLRFTRGRSAPETRATADDFPFLEPGVAGNPPPKGRIPEGRVLARDLRLAWADLAAI
jgi:hypothetical protein